jgi:general stress protein 26
MGHADRHTREEESMPKLTHAERAAFLMEVPGIIMDIGTLDETGAPHLCPIWFLHEEDTIWFTPRQHSAWLGHLRRDPRVALCIDEAVLPYRKVLVRGNARIVHEVGQDDLWRDRYRRIAQRYLPTGDANAYVDGTDDQPRALCAVDLREATVTSWRMPVGDEAYDGIWARRYWTDDAKVRQQAPDLMTRSAD